LLPERRREEDARREKERVAALDESAILFRRAGAVRALVAAATNGSYDLSPDRLEQLKKWALNRAGGLDPLQSTKPSENAVRGWNDWPDEWRGAYPERLYRRALLRALSAGYFARRAGGGSQEACRVASSRSSAR
jgi:hypothetical protein